MVAVHGMSSAKFQLRINFALTSISPGRFFAAVQLKLLIAYIVRHYHFEPLEHRPLNKTFGGHIVPSMTAKVKLRRRKGY